jgi:hypothetical protein
MTVFKENHPFSSLSRQIDYFLWTSVILSCAVTSVALMNMGRLSLFIVPILFMITLTFTFTLLVLTSRDRKKSPEELKGTLAPTSSKVCIAICWILIALWSLSAFIIVIISLVMMKEFEVWERLAGYVELPLVVAEIFLLVVIVLKCKLQRRRTIIEPAKVDWVSTGINAPTQTGRA